MFIYQPSARTIPISECERYQTGWKGTENINPTWKIRMKDVDLVKTTSFFDHVYLVALKEHVRSARMLWIITEICSNQGFPPGLQKNCQKQKPRGANKLDSTEADVISLDAGLRMDGIPALNLWDWSISFLIKPNQQKQRCKRVTEKLVGNSSVKHAQRNPNHEHQSGSDQYWSRSIKRNTLWFQCYVVCLWE